MNYEIVNPNIKYNESDTLIDKILKIRGITNKEEFLNPSSSNLHSPWLLSNMISATDRIKQAINNKETVGISPDIDTDGATSFTIMYKYLLNFGIKAKIIYHQRNDGHGIKIDEVPNELDLLIIVDSSTNSVEECKEISKNTDIIILDHHISDKDNPYAIIVNPQINDYPNKFLSGAGVVFKTCIALDEILETNYAWNYLDICMVGLQGDMMNVTDLETRYLIQHGLYKIGNKERRDFNLGLILKQLGKDFRPNATTISFYLVPFINSIIRLNKIEKIIAILVLDDEKTIKGLIKECIALNDERKSIQKNIVSKLKQIIDNSNNFIFQIMEDTGQKTLNGLIANNIMNTYGKPTFIVSKNNKTGNYVGSARNNTNIDIRSLINENGLGSAEGHEGSFGIEIYHDKLNEFYDLLNKNIKDSDINTKTQVDLEIKNINNITLEDLQEYEKMTFVCGQGFKEPQFLIKGVFKDDYKIMKEIHIKLTCGDIDCVKFNLEESEVDCIKNGFCYDMIGGLSINSWYNFKTKITTKTKQMMINDIKVY